MGIFRNSFLRAKLELSAKRRDLLDSTVNRITAVLTQEGVAQAPIQAGAFAYFAVPGGKPLHGGRLFECLSVTGFCSLMPVSSAPDAPYRAQYGWNAAFAEVMPTVRETRAKHRSAKPFRVDSTQKPKVKLLHLSSSDAAALGLRLPSFLFRAGKHSAGSASVFRITLPVPPV